MKNHKRTITGVVRIPVVVHIVYNAPEENISDESVLSQIRILNEDFRRTNADANNHWISVAADSEIEFYLATSDPNCQPTTGITRTNTATTSFVIDDDGIKKPALGGVAPWDTTKYMNFWVGNLGGGLLGYAQFPGGPVDTDGVVINYQAFGDVGAYLIPQYNLGRTASHEVGHYLNLIHIWGDAPGCATDDLVDDTPLQDDETFGCPASKDSCGGPNMFENYMDYSDDNCLNVFTQGQKTRMRSAIEVARSGLIQPLCSSSLCIEQANQPKNFGIAPKKIKVPTNRTQKKGIPNKIFVHDDKLFSKMISRDFSGGIRYGSFLYNGVCPDQTSSLTDISIAEAASSGTCFTDDSTTPITATIGFICQPGNTVGDPSTIHFGYPGNANGFVIGGTNFLSFGAAKAGWKWGVIGEPSYTGSSATTSCSDSCTSTYCDGPCTISCTATDQTSSGEDCAEGGTGTTFFVPDIFTPLNCGSLGGCCNTFSFPSNAPPPPDPCPDNNCLYSQRVTSDCQNTGTVYSSTCDPSLNVDPTTGACYSGDSAARMIKTGYVGGMIAPSVVMDSFSVVVWVASPIGTPTTADWFVSDTCGTGTPICSGTNAALVCNSLIPTNTLGYHVYGCKVDVSTPCDMTTGGTYYFTFGNVQVSDGSDVYWDAITSCGSGCSCYLYSSTTENDETFSLRIHHT